MCKLAYEKGRLISRRCVACRLPKDVVMLMLSLFFLIDLVVYHKAHIASATRTPTDDLTGESFVRRRSTFYLVELSEFENLLPAIKTCGYTIYGAMSYERWKHHPARTLDKDKAKLFVFPPFLTDEVNWPTYGGGVWDNNYARGGENPGSTDIRGLPGRCSVDYENFIRNKYQFGPNQRYLLHFGSCGWDRGYALPGEAYNDTRAIIAKGNTLYSFYRRGIDISLPPPFTDNYYRMRHLPSSTGRLRDIFLGFKGTLRNHPVRQTMHQLLHNTSGDILILDSSDDSIDYWQLLSRSVFALVIRGDQAFSYRFSEAVCSGAIPVLISDDWVPPFEEVFQFHEYGVRVKERRLQDLLFKLRRLDMAERDRLAKNSLSFCLKHLITPWHQFDTLMSVALSRCD